MLAKILSAGALTLLLCGSALAYIPQQHNIYAGHNNGQPSAQVGQQYAAANSAPFEYNKTQDMGGGG